MISRAATRRAALIFLGALTLGWASLAAVDKALAPPLDRLHRQSTMILDPSGVILSVALAPDEKWRMPVASEDVDPKYLRFLVAYEDQRFFDHHGVDLLAAIRAAGQAARAGHIVSGASTITMQVARMLEPMPRRLSAKFAQAARAFQLERRLSKSEILEAYLALAPFGGNIEGVRAASLAYFGKEPARLTEAEAAMLVALPRSPELTRPDRYPVAARLARDKVLRLMEPRGALSHEALLAALAEPVPAIRHPFPNLAPHLALRLTKAADKSHSSIETTIEAGLQEAVSRVARRHLASLEPQATVAIIVIENRGRKVRAYIGSADPLSIARGGGNDMAQAIRSPGSALKPFIYAMAFEDLAAHPETLMPDLAVRFGDYAPKNFDGFFRGEITAREALQASLNVPAVELMDRVGPRRFHRRIEEAGVTLNLPQGASPGLPMALGGVGVSLEDLVRLYAALADGGISAPLDFGQGHERSLQSDAPATLTSPLGAYYVTRILLDTPPPPSRLAAGNRQGASEIAYKTGTSYGFRDAWAIGYDRDRTIGVWVGRPDGSYSAGRMGRDAAAPILFEVFDLLPQSPAALPAAAPKGAILVGNGELPANLRRFQVLGQARAAKQEQGLRILFPVDGSDIELRARKNRSATLQLEASGGALPLRWLVNGQPLDGSDFRRSVEWSPDGMGAARITVIDGKGRSASSEVWLQ
jgi:penicillin-binding protein 1C